MPKLVFTAPSAPVGEVLLHPLEQAEICVGLRLDMAVVSGMKGLTPHLTRAQRAPACGRRKKDFRAGRCYNPAASKCEFELSSTLLRLMRCLPKRFERRPVPSPRGRGCLR